MGKLSLPKNYHLRERSKRYVPKKLHADDIIQILETPLDADWADHTDDMDVEELLRIVGDRRKHGAARNRYIFDHARAATLVMALQHATAPKTQAGILEILRWHPRATFLPAILPYLSHPATDGTAAEFILNVVWSRNAEGKYNSSEVGAIVLDYFVRNERDEGERSTYALILGCLDYRPAILALIEALSSTNTVTQACAASALGDMQAVEAYDELQRLVTAKHGDNRVQLAFDKISKAKHAAENR